MFNEGVPEKVIIERNNHPPSWFNFTLKKMIEERDMVYKRWKRFRTLDLHTLYRTLKKSID